MENQEQFVQKTTTKKNTMHFLPILLAIVAVVEIAGAIGLFVMYNRVNKQTEKMEAESSNSNNNQPSYSVTIEGLDGDNPIDAMIGQAVVNSLFGEEPEMETIVEDKIYKNGEMAYIQTESGNYYFGVTKATILSDRPNNEEPVYQITWEVHNENRDPYVSVDAQWLTVTDSKGYVLDSESTAYEGEWKNNGAEVYPGKKCIYSYTYGIANPKCDWLEVSIAHRGVICRIDID